MKPAYLEKTEKVDLSDVQSILDVIKEFVSDEQLIPEQKLFAIGYLLNKNKEQYISDLKGKMERQAQAITQLQKKLEILQMPAEPKKKVVVVKKKTV